MILHVAEAGEDRGRVVLRLGPLRPTSDTALRAAVMVAQAFGSEMESLFVEDSQLFDLAGFSFVREVSLSGRSTRPISVPDLERDVKAIARTLHRRVAEVASAAKVRVRTRSMRDDPVRALAQACSEAGPWNVIALAETATANCGPELRDLFEQVADSTGVVLAGPRSRNGHGPVVAAVDEIERLEPTLRAASRLAAVSGGEVRLVLVGEDEESLAWMDAQARLALAHTAAVRLDGVRLAVDGPAAAGVLRASPASFVITRFGGLVVPDEDAIAPLAGALECPLFLVR